MINYKNNFSANKDRYFLSLCFFAVILFQLALLAWLYYTSDNFSSNGMSPGLIGRSGTVVLSLVEFSFFALLIPLILSLSYSFYGKSGKRTSRIKVLNTVSIVTTLVFTAVIPAIDLYLWRVPAHIIFKMIVTLLIAGFFISAIHHFAYSLFRDAFASVTVTYLTLFFLVGGIIFMNPLIEWTGNQESVIWVTLLLNPLVAIASSVNMDILRTDPLYYLSVVSVFKFQYPSLAQFWISYVIISTILFMVKISGEIET
jgi:hypothetical protein